MGLGEEVMTSDEQIALVQAEFGRLHASLPRWHRVMLEDLRTRVLLQAIKDASHVNFPPAIRAALNQVEFYIETHQGVFKET